MQMEANSIPDDLITDGMSPLATKLSNAMSLSEPKPNQIRMMLVSHYDQIARSNNPPSPFDPIELELCDGTTVKIGRPIRGSEVSEPAVSSAGDPMEDAERVSSPTSIAASPTKVKITKNVWFKSKVVSRNHAELWMKNGQIYVKDSGSSSGAFLNGMRLSPAGRLWLTDLISQASIRDPIR